MQVCTVEHQKELLSNFSSRCLSGLMQCPACAIKPLQLTQNAAARLVFNELKRAHVTQFISLHWLPVAAHIKFKTLGLAYRTATSSSPFLPPVSLTSLHALQEPAVGNWSVPHGNMTKTHKIIVKNIFVYCFLLVDWCFQSYLDSRAPDKFSSSSWKLISSICT